MPTTLSQEPTARPRSLAELMSLAAEMEAEAIARYGRLAAEMKRRGDVALAAVFSALLEEERDHAAQVAAWSERATGAAPAAAAWRLPPEIARSWDEIVDSALLTPYRALGIAVLNEERGFAFYSYIAAQAADEAVRAAAEQFAVEELAHATALRRERRRAYHREHSAAQAGFPKELTAESFARCAGLIEADAADLHLCIASRLDEVGDRDGAAMLRRIAADERRAAAAFLGDKTGPPPRTTAMPEARHALMHEALAAAERLHDAYADALEHAADAPLCAAAEEGAARASRHLALIAARLYAPAP